MNISTQMFEVKFEVSDHLNWMKMFLFPAEVTSVSVVGSSEQRHTHQYSRLADLGIALESAC